MTIGEESQECQGTCYHTKLVRIQDSHTNGGCGQGKLQNKIKHQIPRMRVHFRFNDGNFDFNALADTGSGCTLIATDIAKREGITIHKSRIRLEAANGTPMACDGQATVFLTYKDLTVKSSVVVSHDITNEILIGNWRPESSQGYT